MKIGIFIGVVCFFLSAVACFGVPDTEIQYETTDLGSGRWEYIYDVTNISLAGPLEEFTIWYNYELYRNLAIETPDPPAGYWDEIVWQPELVLGDDGGYDAKIPIKGGIAIGGTISGFAVSFDWLGIGEPGSQFYEVINPDTFATIEDGYTVPEPGTVFLVGLGAVIFLRRRRD